MDSRRTTRRRRLAEEVTTAAAGKRGSAIPVSSAPERAARSSPALSSSAASSRSSPPTTRKLRSSPVPVRRSSRPRSTVLGASASSDTVAPAAVAVPPPSPIPEAKEPAGKPSPKSRNNLPTTMTTNTSSRAPHNKLQMTASVHSSYSSSTQQTVEIRTSINAAAGELKTKIGDYLRRSLSKSKLPATDNGGERTHTPTTNSEVEESSRYSGSMSRSIYGDDAEFSDNEKNDSGDIGGGYAFGGGGGIEEEYDEQPPDEEEGGGSVHFKSFTETSGNPLNTTALVTTTSGTSCRQLQVPREFGGVWGALLLMLLGPPLVYYLQWTCDADADCRWNWLDFDLNTLADWQSLVTSFFPPHVVATFVSFQMFVFTCSIAMPGIRVRLPGTARPTEYKFNALGTALLLLTFLMCLHHYEFPIGRFILDNSLRFCLYGFINAFVVAGWMYIRTDVLNRHAAFKAAQPNVYGKSGTVLVDFALGRYINPKWANRIEYKLVFYRISLLSTLVYAFAALSMIFKLHDGEAVPHSCAEILLHITTHIQAEPLALLSTAMLNVYILDAIAFELHLASSFELQDEGFGCLLLLRYAATPFLLAAVPKFLVEAHRLPLPYAGVVAPLTMLLLLSALWLKRSASITKYYYRMHPTRALYKHEATIHTFQGRRLLLGDFWGRLRQPNYTGDIAALCCMALPLSAHFAWPPLVGLVLLVVLLLHRTRRVQERMLARYHSSWVRYSCKVPYVVLPKVY